MRKAKGPTRILVVDDEPSVREFCRRALSGRGLEIMTAGTVRQACALLRGGVDLLLADLVLPGRSGGLDLLRRARDGGNPVVVLMTGHPELSSAVAAVRRHADDYIVKPFTILELKTAVRRALGSRAVRDRRMSPIVSPGAERLLRDHPTDFWQKGEKRVVTVFFADVRRFTPFASQHPPEIATAALNEVLGLVVSAVHEHGGTVNKFLGDGLLAIFGAPVPNEEHAAAAARAALGAVRAVDRLAEARRAEGLWPLRIGVGLNTGEVVAGCVGTRERAEYTVIGHPVNLAARLEEAAAASEVLIGPESAAALAAGFELGPSGLRDFIGLAQKVAVHVLRAAKSP